ncbi:MAG: hypothetical protein M3273_03955 [Actinomycetota bacterium]|nr:hypothetical protein [Actinomycetota bacterium]
MSPQQAGGAAAVDKSENVRLVAQVKFRDGGDIDFDGPRVYAAGYGMRGGVHVIATGGGRIRPLAHVACPGYQNDVATVRPGLIALGYHSSQCGGVRKGIRLLDVSNPRRPRVLGSVRQGEFGTHTLTAYPGRPFVYGSPGGNGATPEERSEYIIDVSNPRRPRVAAKFDPEVAGCHDVAFHIERRRKLAFCAGDTETQIWDVRDPLHPEVLAHIDNPAIAMHHSVAVTSDGELAVIGDESTRSNCKGAPTGALFAYDISDLSAPELKGYFAVERGPEEVLGTVATYGCTAHNFNFRPGTSLMAAAWYVGGMNVIDWSDPAEPVEVAHFHSDRTDYWSAYWHGGRIYANGAGGLDVFEVRGLGSD